VQEGNEDEHNCNDSSMRKCRRKGDRRSRKKRRRNWKKKRLGKQRQEMQVMQQTACPVV